MEVKIVCIAIIAFISVPKAHGDVRDITTRPVRVERSIKDAFSKDDSPETPAITSLRHKVFSLEDSMGKINGEIDVLSKQNADLQDSMLEEKNLMQTIATEFAGLQTQLSTHAEKLSDFEKMISPSKNLFVISNHTCGGVLVGQSGSIVFSTRSYMRRNQFGCVWTIRANNRAVIKVWTNPPSAYSSLNTFIMEILKPNGTQNNESDSQLPQMKITALQKNVHYAFTGPTIFVVTPAVVPQSDIDLYLQFEGIGKLVDKDTFFTHKSLQSNLTHFNNNELETWNSSVWEQSDSKVNYTYDYTTITVSNFSTKVHLQTAIGNGGCSNGGSFIVVTQVMGNSSVVTDCCKTNCKGRNSLINFDKAFFILITKKFQQPMDFNLTWVADPAYPSSSSLTHVLSRTVQQCGGILGGVSGTISYKSTINYRNNERCVWAIVPQPLPKSSITINVNSLGVSDTDDHLYLMQLTDVNGEELPNAPNITKLRRYVTFTPQSREVYIVFYSDYAISGDGFSLTWRVSGDLIKTGSEVATQFTYLSGDNGSATSLSRKSAYTNSFYQVFIFTPSVPTSYVEGLQLELNQTLPVVGASECTQWNISVYTPVNGLLAANTLGLFYNRAPFSENGSCSNSNSRQVILQKADGMVVVVLKSQNASSEIALDFKWSLEPERENLTEVVLADNKCGGVIVANKGSINYKNGTTYSTNERCIWLLHSPKSTNVTFRLVGNSLADSSSTAYIMVTPIDPKEGKLRNDTVMLARLTKSKTVEASMMVVMFCSDSSTRGQGFSLQFTSRDESDSNYSYNLRHVSDANGTIEYDDDDEGTTDIFVLGSSLTRSSALSPRSVDWKGGVFRKANDSCNFDSVVFYTPTSYYSGGWVPQARLPNPKLGSCPDVRSVPDRNDMFTSDTSAFLVIYKPVSNPKRQVNVTAKRFQFDYRALVMVTTCGGTIRADSGRISYKENDRYYNSERCVWDIITPQASMLSFYLEKSGLEECCDLITVYPEGSLSDGVRLSRTNRSAIVRGPRAQVRFTSDSSVTETGFRLRFENSGDLIVQDDVCGGVITGEKGILKYKHGYNYLNNERCIWLIHSPNSTSITLNLQEGGFESCCDYLLVNTIDTDTGTLRNDTMRSSHVSDTHTFEGSLLVVVFRSDASTVGKGFDLRFSGSNNNSNSDPEYSYKLRHISSTDGIISYPSSSWGVQKSPNKEIFVLAHSLNVKVGDDLSTMSTNISWSSGVFKKSNDSCQYGTVSFYSTPTKNGWTTRGQIPSANDISSCANSISVSTKEDIWSTDLTAFLTIFKPISKEQDENSTSFTFTFSKSAGCGGVYVGSSGYISYKENGYYSNNEECIWLLEVPSAETILFNLERSGLEDCCDYITVSSAFDGVVNPPEIISTGNRTATIKGPVAIVTFTSDHSVSQTGFRLLFRNGTQMSGNPPYSYHLFHQNSPRNNFSSEIGPNQVAIMAYSTESHRRVSGGTRINVSAFRPQVNESCQSDNLLFYDVYGRKDRVSVLRKTFSASDIVKDEAFTAQVAAQNCTAFEDSRFSTCENIENCVDPPTGGSFRTNTSTFVAIYSSVNITGSLQVRGFVFSSGYYD